MPTVAELLNNLEVIAPTAKAAGWDPVGLQFGDPTAPADRVAVCHEVTTEVVEALEVDAVDLLVVYHPLLFRPTVRLVAGNSAAGRAYRLIRQGVAVAVVHTAYDVVPGGAADALAAILGLRDVSGFGPLWPVDAVKVVTFVPPDDADDVTAAMAESGAGAIGRYTGCSFRAGGVGTFLAGAGASPVTGTLGELSREPEVRIEMVAPAARRDDVVAAMVSAHPYEEPAYDVYDVAANAGFVGRYGTADPRSLQDLADSVTDLLGGVTRLAGPVDRVVERVAVVPGSGASLIAPAAANADVLVTGDVGHHRAREALDRGLSVIDAGHIATERPGVERLYAAVAAAVPDVRDLRHLDPSPWRRP